MFGQPLFRDAELATYLRQREAAIEPRVTKHLDVKDLARTDQDIVAEELRHALVKPLKVDFDNPVDESSQGRITTADNFYGRVEIDGICATRSFAFTGDPSLLRMRPTRGAGSARGEILEGHVVVGAEGSKDRDWLRRERDGQEAILREYVANSAAEVEAHNALLAPKIAAVVARRRRHLDEVENFRRPRR